MVDHVVGIVLEGRGPILGDKAGQAQPRAQLHQNRLEPAHVAVWLDHRPADAVGDRVGLADRPVEQRNAVVALKVGGVGQHQIGEGDHLRGIAIGVDQLGDNVLARLRVRVGQHVHDAARIHGRVPRHVRHVHEQRVDLIGIAGVGVGDHHVHQPVGRHGVLPGKGLVDAGRAAVLLQRQMLRPAHEAQMRPAERCARGHADVRCRVRLDRLGIGRLEPEPAGHLDRTEQNLQQVQRAAGLEAVGVRRNPAHGVEGDRAADHGLVPLAPEVGPGLVDDDFLFKGRMRQLGRQPPDGHGRHAGSLGCGFRRVGGVEVALGQQHEHRLVCLPLRIGPRLAQFGLHPGFVPGLERAAAPVEHQRLTVIIAQEQAEISALGVALHQIARVGVAAEVVQIDLPRLEQLVHQREDEQAVGARGDAHPLIGDGVVARADRVHAHDLGAAFLEPAQPHLDRVGIVILGNTEDHEHLGPLPVRLTKLPKRAAHGVDPGSGHIDRAEPAVGSIIGGAKLLRPPAGKGLRLIAAGEKRQLLRVLLPDRGQPFDRQIQRFIPADLAELTRAARTGP